jgi:hypothetical protein
LALNPDAAGYGGVYAIGSLDVTTYSRGESLEYQVRTAARWDRSSATLTVDDDAFGSEPGHRERRANYIDAACKVNGRVWRRRQRWRRGR